MISVFGLGNPLMDIIMHASPEDLVKLGAVSGSMNLVDYSVQRRIIESVEPATYSAGGSCANTIRGIAWLSGESADLAAPLYTGAIGRDDYGDRFEASMTEQRVITRLVRKPVPTGTSAVLVTPDHERTMFTHLGACREFLPSDLDLTALGDSMVFHTTGYMWDTPNQEEAARSAMVAAREQGIPVSFDIADPFVADRYREKLLSWLPGRIDILFANLEELKSLTAQSDSRAAAPAGAEDLLLRAAKLAPIVVLKVGSDGCYIESGGRIQHVPGEPVQPVDTTGAGDAFASGFLHRYLLGGSLTECGRQANRIASRIVTVLGCNFRNLLRGDVLV